jgi:hypothetical protein
MKTLYSIIAKYRSLNAEALALRVVAFLLALCIVYDQWCQQRRTGQRCKKRSHISAWAPTDKPVQPERVPDSAKTQHEPGFEKPTDNYSKNFEAISFFVPTVGTEK